MCDFYSTCSECHMWDGGGGGGGVGVLIFNVQSTSKVISTQSTCHRITGENQIQCDHSIHVTLRLKGFGKKKKS